MTLHRPPIKQAYIVSENSVWVIIQGVMDLEQISILTYNLPPSRTQEGCCVRARMKHVAPNEKPWNPGSSLCLTLPKQAPD